MIRVLYAALVAALVAGAACSGTSPAPERGATALRAAIDAERTLVYVGYKRTIYGEEGEGRQTRMKVERRPSGQTILEWEQGEGSTRRWSYDDRVGWRSNPDLLLRNYVVTVDPADGPAVAWRETRRLQVRGRQPGRPTLDLYVDKETSVVLREEIRDADGRLWLTNVFDSIDYQPAVQTSDAPSERLALPRAAAEEAPTLPLAVTTAPAGFVRAGGEKAVRGGPREDWTDGLAAFSVYQRAAGPGRPTEGEGELERRTCPGRASVAGVFAGTEVRVVGNLVPAGELEAVVRALSRSD